MRQRLGDFFRGKLALASQMQNIVGYGRVGFDGFHVYLPIEDGTLYLQAAVQGHRRVPSGLAEFLQQRTIGALKLSGQAACVRLNCPG